MVDPTPELTKGRFIKSVLSLSDVDVDGCTVEVGEFTSAHGFNTCPVLYQDLVIINGDHDGDAYIVALESETGKVRWSVDDFGDGMMLLSGDRLLALMESGELVFGQATPAGWREISRAQVVGSGARSQPALADGRLYVRDRNQLVCLDAP